MLICSFFHEARQACPDRGTTDIQSASLPACLMVKTERRFLLDRKLATYRGGATNEMNCFKLKSSSSYGGGGAVSSPHSATEYRAKGVPTPTVRAISELGGLARSAPRFSERGE